MSTANRSTLLASVGVAALAGIVFGCLGGGIAGYRIGKAGEDRAGGVPVASVAKSSTLPTRDEFRAQVLGKTTDQVIASAGRPNSTRDDGDGSQTWTYYDRTRDPATGRVDMFATLYFRDGKVAEVRY